MQQKGDVSGAFMGILIKNAGIYAENGIQTYQGLCIDGGRIRAMTNNEAEIDAFLREHDNQIYTIEGRNKLILPGLINTHTHSPMTLLRNIGSDLPLQQWLFNEIIPRERKLTSRSVYYGSLLGQLEMIRSGTVAFADMYEPFEAIAQAVLESGLKAVLSVPVLHNRWENGTRITENNFAEAERLIKKWKGAGDGRIDVICEIHSVYLYDDRLLHEAVSFAKENGLGIHMHLHETKKEISDCLKAVGMRPAAFFASIGAFDVPVLAAHCTHLETEDFEILRRARASVSVNITSNLKLASGVPPLPELLAAGIRVGLGTDGCASNNNLNLFEEMHLAGILYKGLRGDPALVSPEQVIDAAVFGSRICKGADADLILIDLTAAHLNPLNDMKSAVVYSMQASDVDTVIVRGEILMEHRELKKLDEERILYEVNHVKL